MLAVTRREIIKDIIFEKKSVIVSNLAKQFSVTEETVRRDLKHLEEAGILMRTYGGAFIQDGVQNEVDLTVRETAYVESKRAIAEKSLSLIKNGDSIFLDSSTTALFIAKVVHNMRITVVTNSLKVINLLSDSEEINLIIIGGKLDKRNMAFAGFSAASNLDNFYLDKSFISCRSLSLEHGITDSNENNAFIRKKVIERSDKKFIIADYSKFDKTSFIKLCNFSDIDGVISDFKLSPEWTKYFDKNSIQYHNAWKI